MPATPVERITQVSRLPVCCPLLAAPARQRVVLLAERAGRVLRTPASPPPTTPALCRVPRAVLRRRHRRRTLRRLPNPPVTAGRQAAALPRGSHAGFGMLDAL